MKQVAKKISQEAQSAGKEEKNKAKAEKRKDKDAFMSDDKGDKDAKAEDPEEDQATKKAGGAPVADAANNISEETNDIKTNSLEELKFSNHVAAEVQNTWKAYLAISESPGVGGEGLFTAVFEASPALKPMFT